MSLFSELRARTLGIRDSKHRLEKTARNLLVDKDNQFKLINQVNDPSENLEGQWNLLKITPDGFRTVALLDTRVVIYDNVPSMSQSSKKSEYNLIPSCANSWYPKHGFEFNRDGTRIFYRTFDGTLVGLDLETGKVSLEQPFRGFGPIQFYGNKLLTLDMDTSTIQTLSLGPMCTNILQDVCRFNPRYIVSQAARFNELMDANPFDFSTMVILDTYKNIGLYDIRKLTRRPSAIHQLGGDDRIGFITIPENAEVNSMKFSPNGKKIAAVIRTNQEYQIDLNVYDVDANLNRVNCLQLVAHDLHYGQQFYWYNDNNICFVHQQRGKVVAWNVDNNKMTDLCPCDEQAQCSNLVYVHPTLPLLATYPTLVRPTRHAVFKLWSI